MTRYTVVWTQRALDQLSDLWLDSMERGEIGGAANLIDTWLATDPDQAGIPIGGNLRRLWIPPLDILFAVREADRVVEVVRIRLN